MSEALYLRDPDGNGVELYRDRPCELWPRSTDGTVEMFTRPLDAGGLLAEIAPDDEGNPTICARQFGNSLEQH